eukprot:scaffold97857_cov63-Phaeocystis_antarctica.AAC.2
MRVRAGMGRGIRSFKWGRARTRQFPIQSRRRKSSGASRAPARGRCRRLQWRAAQRPPEREECTTSLAP